MLQRVYHQQGLIHAYFQRLPGQKVNPLYLTLQTQIAQNVPQPMGFGLTQLPIVGDLLKVDYFLWKVEQMIHQPVRLEQDSDDLFARLLPEVATIQVSFHAALS